MVKRVGWALEEFGPAPDLLAPLRAYPARGDSPSTPAARRAAATTQPGTRSRTCAMVGEGRTPLRPLRYRAAAAAHAVGKPRHVTEKDCALSCLHAVRDPEHGPGEPQVEVESCPISLATST